MAKTHDERSKAIEEADGKSIVDVANSLGMDLVRTGRNYLWSEHDSMVIRPARNAFYWNSRRIGGGPIQLVESVKECSFREAVNFINGTEIGKFSEKDFSKKKPFRYFMKEDPEMAEVKKYLLEERKLSAETIDFFVKQGVIAQAVYKNPDDGPRETVVVFKHKDLAGNVKGVGLQGIYEDWETHPDRGRLKRTFGDGFTGMSVRIGNPPTTAEELSKDRPLKIIAFEAPIDLMSYYELHKDTLQDVVLLSMNGLRKGTVSQYIANTVGFGSTEEEKVTYLDELNSRVKSSELFEIVLAVDNDEAKPVEGTEPVEYVIAGQDFVDDFGVENIQVSPHMPPLVGNQKKSDWNEYMKLQKEAFQKWSELTRDSQNEILIVAKENPPNLNLMLEKHGLRDAELKFSNFSSMLTSELVTRYNSDLVEGVHAFNTERQKWLDQHGFGNTMYIPEMLWDVAEKHGLMENYPKAAPVEAVATKSDPLEKSAVPSPSKGSDQTASNSQKSENDNSRLAQAKRKLARLEGEANAKIEEMYAHQRLTNGQPMNDKGKSGAAWFKAHEKIENQVSDRLSQIAEQKERVERLEYQEELKARGMNQQGGLIMSVENIPRIRQEIERSKNGDSMFTKATIRKYEKKLPELEQLLEQSAAAEKNVSDQARLLIDSGTVTQWPKNPTIYFVKELRKVALELTPEGIFQPAAKYPAKTEEEKARIEELLSENKKMEEGASMSFKGNDNLLKNYYADSAETISKGFNNFMTETVDQNYRNEMWDSLKENFISYEKEMVERGLLNPENIAAETETVKNVVESSQLREDFSGDQNLEDSLLSKNETGSDRYLEVEFNESNPTMGIRRYQGEIVTAELVGELYSLESRVADEPGYYKFFFDEVVDGKVVERHRMDIGDGLEVNKPMYDFLKEAAVSQERATKIKPGLIVAGGSNQKVESAETVEVQPVDRYFRVEFNEQIMPLVFDNYAGQIVTRDFISELYSLENRGGYPVESCKFVFAEVVNGEVIDHIEMEIGGNYAENKGKHDQLAEGAVSQEKAEEIKKEQQIPEEPTVENTIVDQQPSVQLEMKPGEPEISKNESSKIMQASSSDFLSEFKQALDDTFDQMEKKPEGTSEYLTKTELDQILDEHLTKIEQLVSHFTTSDSLLENPTEEQRVGLVRGMLETVKAAITQFKEDLMHKLSTKKDNVIFSVKDTTDNLRISTKNSINGRILKINDSIKNLTEKIDSKFVLEEKAERLNSDSKASEEQVTEAVESAVALAEGAVKEPTEPEKSDLIELAREYLQLTEETNKVSESIRVEIVNNPLANVHDLQEILVANQQLLKKLEQQISAKMPAHAVEETKEQSAAAVVSVAALVKERDELVQQRDALAHRPDFLQSMSTDAGKGSLVAQFKELDSKVSALDKEIESVENGTKEVVTPEKQRPENDPFTLAAATDKNVSKEVPANQAASVEKSVKPIQEISKTTNVNELTANLKAGVKDLLNPDSFKNYLDSASKFHSYSSNNVQLIMNQDPEATQVASQNKWNQLGYEVNPNAKELLVYAPNFQVKQDDQGQPVLDERGKEVKELAGFRLTPVYDVRHTSAEKSVNTVNVDLSNADHFTNVYSGLVDATKASVTISSFPDSNYSVDENTISIEAGLGQEQTIKALIQMEAGLNYSQKNQNHKFDPLLQKFESVAVSYIVFKHLGLDTSSVPLDFVSSMKEKYSVDKINQSLDAATKQASVMIKEIDKKFDQVKSLSGPKNKFEERVARGKMENQRVAAEAKNRNHTPETKENSTAIRM